MKMTQKNSKTGKMSDNDLAECNAAMTTLAMKLLPYLKSHGGYERMEAPRTGDETAAFLQRVFAHCVANPELVSGIMNIDEFRNDVSAVQSLRRIYATMHQFADAVNNTIQLLESDAFLRALLFYGAVKTAKQSGTANVDDIYDDLTAHFPENR
jgi:hypothetical protein